MQWSDRIGRRIKLRDLHLLQAVANAGSMTKAAHELAISVPVVSKAIADLEHTVGVPLLERNPQGVEPTAYGRALMHRSVIAFEELRQGIKDIEFLTDPTAGEVRIGATPPLAASFVSAVVDRLSRRHPRIVFRVAAGGAEPRPQSLIDRSADLLVSRRSARLDDERLSFETLFESPYVVAAGKNSPWVRRRRVRLAELMDEAWALPPPDNSFGPFVVEAFRASGLDFPSRAVQSSALEMRASLLKTGRYLAIVPEFWLQFPERHPFVRKLPIELPISGGPIGIMTLKNRALSPVAQLFIETAREVAKPLAKTKGQGRHDP
jgi:DNA-binding transcriptional LysR family regulator